MPGDDDLLVAARRSLLDALEALGPHADSAIVIGAQAVYLHTGALDLAIAELTKDADIALDSRALSSDPLIEDALTAAGFYPNPDTGQPGSWCSPAGMPVDLMVPEALAGPAAGGRRGARLPPHSNHAMRRAVGLEACVVDYAPREIGSLDEDDHRILTANVAGPAGLLVAKLHKVGERISDGGHRAQAKDAHDIYRLLVAIDTTDVAATLGQLLATEPAAQATGVALDYLRDHFLNADAQGALLAGEAEVGVGDPDQVSAAVSALTRDLFDALP